MKLRVQHRKPPQNLLITKHSPFPLPPHFQSHWDRILTNTSNDLCNLIRKHHEEERDILETKINHLTSCLRITATKDQMKQYMQLKLTVNPTATTQHGPIDDAIQDIYKPHNFEHSTMVHQQDTDTTCTPTEPRTRRPTNTKCGQTYNPTTSTPRQTTQSNIKALDKDAYIHTQQTTGTTGRPTHKKTQTTESTNHTPSNETPRTTWRKTHQHDNVHIQQNKLAVTSKHQHSQQHKPPLSSQKSSTHVYQIHKTTYDNTTITLKKLQTPETTQPTQEHNIDAAQHNTHNKRNQDTIHITYRHNQGTTTDAHQHTPLTRLLRQRITTQNNRKRKKRNAPQRDSYANDYKKPQKRT